VVGASLSESPGVDSGFEVCIHIFEDISLNFDLNKITSVVLLICSRSASVLDHFKVLYCNLY
jgi:hypothetical protein